MVVVLFCLNQLGRVNELLIKPDLSDFTEENVKEDVVDNKETEKGSGGDCIFTVTSIDTALSMVKSNFPTNIKNLSV